MEREWFWICSLPGFYRKDLKLLLQYFGSPGEVMNAAARELAGIPFLKEEQKKRLLCHRERFEEEMEYHKCRERGIEFISHKHSAYPKRLLQTADYPYGLFVKGKLPEEGDRCIAVVGARMCSNYGRAMARELSVKLAANGVCIISGLAYGVDGIAQSSCLEAGGQSIAVMGCGVDICYPRENRELYEKLPYQGGVISEYPPGTKALPGHFPLRNRIISGMSELVVVVEAKKKSGSLITADIALEQGRDVFVFPGRIGDALSEGCNGLIAQGAGIVTDIDTFLVENGIILKNMKKKKNCNIMLATAENMVYSCLDSRPKDLQRISEEAKMPVNQVMSAISSLQMKEIAEETAKNYYVKKR